MAHKDDDWSRTVFSDETSYQLFRNTIRRWSKYMLKKKKKEFRRTNKRSWYGVHLVLKVNCRAIPFEQLWMDLFMLKYFENIFLRMQENSLGVVGDTNKTTTPNTPVK